MRSTLLLFLSFIMINVSFGQAVFTKLLEKKYSDLPIHIRIENSGIYGISSFDVEENNIWIQDFDTHEIHQIAGNQLQKISNKIEIASDFIGGNEQQSKYIQNYYSAKGDNFTIKKTFLLNTEKLFVDNGGVLTDAENDKIVVSLKSKTELNILYSLSSFSKSFNINQFSNLAYADLIGIDGSGNSFVLTESYINEIPLKVKKEIYTLSPDGRILSILEVPSIDYLYLVKEFEIDSQGNLYQLLTDKEKITIVKWSGLTNYSSTKISYPSEYNYELNYNNIVPEKEAKLSLKKVNSVQSTSRTNAIRIGESYALYKYYCSAKNLSPSDVKGPDGDIVRTPSWLIPGENARVPYMWGGFSSLTQFKSGLQNGKYAGDINTAGVSGYSVGVDCSGFVSRCWQLSYHSSTSDMPSITTQYASWDDLKPGDAIHKVGHVRLFVEKTSNGALRVVEASARDWDVSYWTYKPSDLTAYTPRYYKGIVSDYSFNQPELESVTNKGNNELQISWKCDTTNVFGYRLYKSTDGIKWDLFKDESELKICNTNVSSNGEQVYFRVASVLDNPPSYTESNWSNVLGSGKFVNSKKVLIVDGFTRKSGDWRGVSNTFSSRYGQVLNASSISFESVMNSQVINSQVDLNNYDAVYWILGDESTVDETFSITEQEIVARYLENGGKLFVSGSEIGWDLDYKGSASDKEFYHNYLKASYVADDAGSNSVKGINGGTFNGSDFYIAQTYEVNYPDVIDAYDGSTLCMDYANGKGAGIEYTGLFGNSLVNGKLINLGFPLESTANDSAFGYVLSNSLSYFFPGITSIKDQTVTVDQFGLSQNYPNPFNPITVIEFYLPEGSHVSLKIYNSLGEEVSTLIDKMENSGKHNIRFNGNNLSSGIYFYRLTAGKYNSIKKMILLK